MYQTPEYTSSSRGAQVYDCDNLASVCSQADTACTRPPEYTSSSRGAQVYYCDNLASVCSQADTACTIPQSTPALGVVNRSITVIILRLFVHRLIRHVPDPQSTPALAAVHRSILDALDLQEVGG